jgi:pilus assembly protein CpaC
MHRITGRLSLWWGSMMIALSMAGGQQPARAQEPTAQKPSALIVPINGTVKLQMSTKKPIRTVTNPKENAINIRTVVGDPTTILIIGQQPDVTRVELKDVDGNTETYEVIVQADIEYLRTQMRRAVPTANVTPIPTSSNTVILAGTVTRAEDVAIIRGVVQSVGFQYIDAMRVGGVQQVQLDVVIAKVSRSDIRSMAFNFLADSRNWFGGSTVGLAAGQPPAIGTGAPFSVGALSTGGLINAPGAPNGVPSNFIGGVLHNGWGFLLFLEAMRSENLLKLMAEPRLVTISGRPASFLAGGEQAIPVPAGLGQIGVQFEEFGTRLNFIPIVLGNGRIRMEVEPEVSNLDPAAGVSINGTIVPGRVTNRVNTTIEMESGQTFVIGGLIQHQVGANDNKVPVLGDLPYFGTLFRSIQYTDQEQEVVILVTPWLVDPESCDQRPKILPGEETRKPDDFELFLEGILEAPRGPRQVCQHCRYVAPYKNSPSVYQFPCAGPTALTGPGGNQTAVQCSNCYPGGQPLVPPPAVGSAPVPPGGPAAMPGPGMQGPPDAGLMQFPPGQGPLPAQPGPSPMPSAVPFSSPLPPAPPVDGGLGYRTRPLMPGENPGAPVNDLSGEAGSPRGIGGPLGNSR